MAYPNCLELVLPKWHLRTLVFIDEKKTSKEGVDSKLIVTIVLVNNKLVVAIALVNNKLVIAIALLDKTNLGH